MDINKLREQLKIDEGVEYRVYNDHLGYKTLGIGHLVVPGDLEYDAPVETPVSEERVNEIFDKDVITYIDETKKVFGNLEGMPEEAQQVLVNMCFNMGAPRLAKFKNFIRAIHDEDWKTASTEALDSRWATQVGPRAIRLAERIRAIN